MRVRFRSGALAVLFGLGSVAGASAQTWVDAHPWRVQVHSRLAQQDERIRQGLLRGQLTRAEAGELHAHVYAIGMQERALAHFHGGHLTPGERAYLNREANRNSAAIYRARHRV